MDDCDHIVEVNAMDRLMKQNEESGEKEIKVLVFCLLIPIKLNVHFSYLCYIPPHPLNESPGKGS